MSSPLPERFDPATTEPALYAAWEAGGVHGADPARTTRAGGTRTPFAVVIPPPNVTAVLHMGHGLNYNNVRLVCAIDGVEELNIGHSIVARAVMVGMERAVREMKEAIAG